MHFFWSIQSSLVIFPFALAQTYTSCNPLTSTSCSSDAGLSASSFSTDLMSISSLPSEWTASSGSSLISYSSDSGAKFTISKSGDAPTIQTSFYIFFGTISVFMKSASGTGIVSSVVLESDCLDEIDWEWIGGNDASVQSNYFGKGNTTSYDRAIWSPVSGAQRTVHNYTVDWRSDATDWYIDSVLVRTLKYVDAVGGANYPQTPMRLKIGIWAGGDTTANSAGTVSWAGGATDFSAGPFNMEVTDVKIMNMNPASEYKYGDQTGNWQSIQVVGDSGTLRSVANSSASTSGAVVTSLAMSGSKNGTVTAAAQSTSNFAVLSSNDAMAWRGSSWALVLSVATWAIAFSTSCRHFTAIR